MAMSEEERKARQREATKRWRERNPEKALECSRKSNLKDYWKDPDKRRAKTKAWREANPEKYKANHAAHRERHRDSINARQRELHFNRLYGINRDDIPFIVAKQGGCKACQTKDPGPRGWAVDHCHKTNEYRGILCHPCNLALGLVEDDIEKLKKLIDYLER